MKKTGIIAAKFAIILLLFIISITGICQPILKLENMTKMSGTNQGFPADDYYVFNMIKYPARSSPSGVILYGFVNSQRMRLHNIGTSKLTINEMSIEDKNLFRINGISKDDLPLSILSGSYIEIEFQFTDSYNEESIGNHFYTLVIKSNGGNKDVTLAGGYTLKAEGSNELTLKNIFELFGITTEIPEGHLPSDFPIAGKATRADFGEIVVSEYWEQLDKSVPVRAIQLIAQKSSGGSPVSLIDRDGKTVSGFSFKAQNEVYKDNKAFQQCQSILPKLDGNTDMIAGGWADFVDKPFRISINNSTTSGSGDTNPETGKPYFLSPKMYPVRGRDGKIIPGHYVAAMDFTPLTGSEPSNSDFNDNVVYFTNIRPKDNRAELNLSK